MVTNERTIGDPITKRKTYFTSKLKLCIAFCSSEMLEYLGLANPRRAWGECLDTPPSLLECLFIRLFRTCYKNFRPRSHKVRSPGHVKWPHLRKRLNARPSYTEWRVTWKLLGIDVRNSIYNMHISEHWYRWPKVRPILRSFHYKSTGNIERRLFLTKTIRDTLKHRVTGRFDTLNRNIATSDPPLHVAKVILDHERSPTVFRQYFLVETSYSDENTIDVFRPTIRIGWCTAWRFQIW